MSALRGVDPSRAAAAGANASWLARSLASVWHPCTQMKAHETLPLVPLARAEGVWLEDFEGRRILDAVSSWWVNLFGHGEPRIRAAIETQLRTLEHAMLAGFTHRPAVELAERLSALAPGRLGHAFYASDGASATEIALNLGTSAAQNSMVSAISRSDGSGGQIQVPRDAYSLRMSFWMVPVSFARGTPAFSAAAT